VGEDFSEQVGEIIPEWWAASGRNDGRIHLGMLGAFSPESAGQGQSIGLICKGLSISEQSYYRWRRDYGGLKLDQAKRLKDLERENERLRKAISELTLDKLILKEALEGKY